MFACRTLVERGFFGYLLRFFKPLGRCRCVSAEKVKYFVCDSYTIYAPIIVYTWKVYTRICTYIIIFLIHVVVCICVVSIHSSFICFWWRHELRQLWYMRVPPWVVCVFSLGYSSAPEWLEPVLWPRIWLCELIWEQQQTTTTAQFAQQCLAAFSIPPPTMNCPPCQLENLLEHSTHNSTA